MTHFVWTAALALLLTACTPSEPPPAPQASTAGATPAAPAACGKDTDCKGDRICDAGVCQAPAATASASPAPAPATSDQGSEARLQAALITALSPKPGDPSERQAESGPVIQAYAKAGYIPLKPNLRADYSDYRLFIKPAGFLGHTLVAIDEEYMAQYIGCCASPGLAVTLRVTPQGQDLEAFAKQQACSLDRDEHATLHDPSIGLPKAPKGTYVTLSCKTRDASNP